jgi:hypothetical protein
MLLMQVQCGYQILANSKMLAATRMPVVERHQIGDTRLTVCISYLVP